LKVPLVLCAQNQNQMLASGGGRAEKRALRLQIQRDSTFGMLEGIKSTRVLQESRWRSLVRWIQPRTV